MPLLAADATSETWVTLPEVTELLRATVVTTPETLVVTPVKAVAGLPFPDRDWGEWGVAPTGQSYNASGATPPQPIVPKFRHIVPGYALPPSRTAALAVPTAEDPARLMLVLKVDDTAEALPDALALDHPDGRVTLAKGYRWGVLRYRESARFVTLKHLQYFRVLKRGL